MVTIFLRANVGGAIATANRKIANRGITADYCLLVTVTLRLNRIGDGRTTIQLNTIAAKKSRYAAVKVLGSAS
jgi:hypothetical protein